jgi:predicted enzyme related to lactoylglutathione lyase
VKIKASNTILYCHKWHDTVAFYRDELRLPITFSKDWFVEFKLTEYSSLSVANEKEATIKSCHGQGLTISLEVADIEAMHTKMQKHGLKPTSVKDIWESKQFYIHDPEGNRIEFWSR